MSNVQKCFKTWAKNEENASKIFKKVEYSIELEWTIDDFLAKPSAVGDKMSVGWKIPEMDLKFEMEVYPGGESADSSGFLSLYLVNKNNRNITFTTWKDSVIKDGKEVAIEDDEEPIEDDEEPIEDDEEPIEDDEERFTLEAECGFAEFIKRTEIAQNPEKYLQNGALVLRIQRTIEDNIEISSEVVNKETETAADVDVIKDIKDLFLEEGVENLSNTDVSLTCEKGEIKCHKVILASRSTVFRGYFKEENDTMENKTNTVAIKDASFESVKEMVTFFYTNEFNGDHVDAGELLYLAQKYDIQGWKTKIEEVLCTRISVENAAELAKMGNTFIASKLEKMACDFMMRNLDKVTRTSGWSDLMKSDSEIINEMFRKMQPPTTD